MYTFMQTHQHYYSMRALCTALRVSRSGYYAWCARDKLPCALNVAIECQFKQDKARTGAPSIASALKARALSAAPHSGPAHAALGVARALCQKNIDVPPTQTTRMPSRSNHGLVCGASGGSHFGWHQCLSLGYQHPRIHSLGIGWRRWHWGRARGRAGHIGMA